MKQILTKLMILFFALASCKTESKETQIFDKYLNKTFNLKIPKGATQYILMSNSGCHGCVSYVQSLAINGTIPDGYIFILPNQLDDGKIKPNPKILFDSTGAINYLKFHKGNVGKVWTKDGVVLKVKAYEPTEVSSILQD